jgi:hypothetical protein
MRVTILPSVLTARVSAAKLDDGAEGTAQAYFVLELSWRFDRFVFKGTQVMAGETLQNHLKGRLQHAEKETRSGEHCKLNPGAFKLHVANWLPSYIPVACGGV